jgi:hypothetical protein
MLGLGDKEASRPQKFSGAMTAIGSDRQSCVNYTGSFVAPGKHFLVYMANMLSGARKNTTCKRRLQRRYGVRHTGKPDVHLLPGTETAAFL